MPNLDYHVRRVDSEHGDIQTAVGVKAVGEEFRTLVKEVLDEALKEGERVARALAPRGPLLDRNRGHRISDAVRIDEVPRYVPGGAGGGGYYERALIADSTIAPHLPFVFDGTKRRIYPTRGNVLALQKEGEGVHFRRFVSGQRAQQEWWREAERAMEAKIEERLQTARFIHGI